MRTTSIQRFAVAVEKDGISGLVQNERHTGPDLFAQRSMAQAFKREVKESKLRVVAVLATFQWE